MRKFTVVPKFGERSFGVIENIVGGKFAPFFKEIISEYGGKSIYENHYIDKNGIVWVFGAFVDFALIYKLTKQFKENGWGLKVPFAYDQGGWHFCLSFDEETYGKIIVNRWTDHSPEEQFAVIADSFEAFIHGLS